MTYLFVGTDAQAKENALNQLKARILPPTAAQFNYDCLYGKEATRKLLQEKIGFLPLHSPSRLLVIKDAASLKEEAKEYLKSYLKAPAAHIVLVLDYDEVDRRDAFIADISRYVTRTGFKETQKVDTFSLARHIEAGKTGQALRILQQLLTMGEKPERIMGGLRYAWERSVGQQKGGQEKLALLLTCDIEVKTGRLKPELALEKLVIALSGFAGPAANP